MMFTCLVISSALLSAPAPTDCEGCHQKKTPGVFAAWKSSQHGAQNVGCAECHPGGYDAIHSRDRRPATLVVCAGCHEKPATEHAHSKHGQGFRAGRACTRKDPKLAGRKIGCDECHQKGSQVPTVREECARFLNQTPAMQRQGCLSCHGIENRCDTCHGSHTTDLSIARDPGTCATCHMGPDHAQWEMWQTSKHGIRWQLDRNTAPSCQTCHQAGGTHDVSQGISMGLAGQPYPEKKRRAGREAMLNVCDDCHGRDFAARQLEDADQIQKEAKALVDEGAAIVRALNDEGLLMPGPTERPSHPLSGAVIELGPQMVYEHLSRPEAIFFEMKKFHYVTTYKGAFHQNPDYAHWYGNAPLKLALSKLQSEALLLRRLARIEERASLWKGGSGAKPKEMHELEKKLRVLKDLHLKGDIDDAEMTRRKNGLLDGFGL